MVLKNFVSCCPLVMKLFFFKNENVLHEKVRVCRNKEQVWSVQRSMEIKHTLIFALFFLEKSEWLKLPLIILEF